MEPFSPTFYAPSLPTLAGTCYFCGASTQGSAFSQVCEACLTETAQAAERRRSVNYWLRKAKEAADLANFYWDIAAGLQAEGQGKVNSNGNGNGHPAEEPGAFADYWDNRSRELWLSDQTPPPEGGLSPAMKRLGDSLAAQRGGTLR